ncbi:MAG: DUF2868 domain-containing protein [Rubrivivax sp.]|nr:DUF2868 domain-containing protein [Rubrivivax sp.]
MRQAAAAGAPGGAPAVDEDTARALCLVRACETGAADDALWSPEDAAWASRLADETAGPKASAAQWLAARAQHALRRILPRRAALARAFERRRWSGRWVAAAALVAALLGAASHVVGAGQVVDLLAAPLWAVVAWNGLVYAWLAVAALRHMRRASRGARQGRMHREAPVTVGPLRRTAQRWFGAGGSTPLAEERARTPEQRFALGWARTTAPLSAWRAAWLLHVAALALALGLLAGLYGRALVLDYRAGWQSTLLEPAQVHTLLSTLLAPASAVSGIAVPGVDAVAQLRTGPGGAPLSPLSPAASAAQTVPWLHLFAFTLALAVGVPRSLLALHAAWRSWLGSRRLPLAIEDPYTAKLLLARRGAAAAVKAVQVLAHGFAPSPQATLALRSLLVAQFGSALELHAAPATAYGDEDGPVPAAPPGTGWRIAWFDLAATPEAQAQGAFVAALRAASPPLPLLLLVDEAGYRQRMGATSPRLDERRRAWQGFADEAGVALACVDLAATAAAAGPGPSGGDATAAPAATLTAAFAAAARDADAARAPPR